jgi:transposase
MQIHYEETVMRFVPIKSPEQQAELAVHRIRQRLMGERTALINQLRGLLAEFGLVLAPGANHVRSKLLCGNSPRRRRTPLRQGCGVIR